MTNEEAKSELMQIYGMLSEEKKQALDIAIKALEQEPKTGWHIAHGMYEDRFWCSCGYIKIIDSNTSKWKYCPVCGGTKMVEPQEREDKECTKKI